MQVTSGNSLLIYSGGTANSTTVNDGGRIFVSSGGTANETTVNSGGMMFVRSGGTASVTTVNSDGWMIVSSGGTASVTTVNSGGSIFVSSGGTANDITVSSGGKIKINGSDTVLTGTLNLGGNLQTSDNSVDASGLSVVFDITERDGTEINAMVDSLANLTGASPTAITVSAEQTYGDYMLADDAAAFADTITVKCGDNVFGSVSLDNSLHLEDEGVEFSLNLNSAGTLLFSVNEYVPQTYREVRGIVVISSGVTSSHLSVGRIGQVHVSNGGLAMNTILHSSGMMLVSKGGIAQYTLMDGGTMRVFSGGTAMATTIDDGELFIQSGVSASATLINGGGMTVSGGFVEHTTVNTLGQLSVRSGGTAAHTALNAGGSMTVSNGGEAVSTLVAPDGTIIVYAGGAANDTTVSGMMDIYSGGTANGTTIVSGGEIDVHNGGRANGTTIVSGEMTVSNGGTATGTTVVSGGSLSLMSGALHCGTMKIAEGAVVSAHAGATIDFTVAEQADAPLVDRIDFISWSDANAPSFTLTVNSDQVAGYYALAGHAEDFNSVITVRTIDGGVASDIGTLSLDGSLTYNDSNYYRLFADTEGILTLAVNVCDVTNTTAGSDGSFDDAILTLGARLILFDSSNVVYSYLDGLTATHPLEIVGNGIDATTLAGGNLYLAGNDASFSDLTLSGKVIGGASASSGIVTIEGVSLAFEDFDMANGGRIYGGMDASGTGIAIAGDISLSLDNVDGGNSRIYAGGRVAGSAKSIMGNIDVSITCSEDGSFGNYYAGAEAASFDGIIEMGTVSTTICGGKFSYCGNGSLLLGGTSVQKDSTLTIEGGTFDYFVYAGAYSRGGTAVVNGDTTLVIRGGTFNSRVFGGNGAYSSADGGKTLVNGNSCIVVDGSSSLITFNDNVYAGSIGYGHVNGGTTIKFTGQGSNIVFSSDSFIMGGSQSYRGTAEFVGGDMLLRFEDFSGALGANVNNTFTRIELSGSIVAFGGETVKLDKVSSWSIEVASDEAELTLDHGKNSFKGDSLELTLADGAVLGDEAWSVVDGVAATLSGWDKLSDVTIFGKEATFSDGAWTTDSHRLFKEDNSLKVAAVIA